MNRFFRKTLFMVMLICLFCASAQSAAAAKKSKVKATTYKIVYHYSLEKKSRKVVKTYPAGTRPSMLTASEVGFKSSDHVFLGWNGYREPQKQWALRKGASGIKYGTYKAKSLYLLKAGKKIFYTPKAGDTIHLYGCWEKKQSKFIPDAESTTSSDTYKVIYHYSLNDQTRKVVKTYKAETKPTMMTAKQLGFTSSTNTFLGWYGYRERLNQWVLSGSTLEDVQFGKYNRSKLYLMLPGKSITYKPKAGDAFHLFGAWEKNQTEYVPAPEADTAQNTYKIVYHYSLENQTRKVIKTYKVGEKPIMMTAKQLGFTSSTDTYLGWYGYRERLNQWVLSGSTLADVEFGKYNKSKLYLMFPGKTITYNPKAGDAFHLFGAWEKKQTKYVPDPEADTAQTTYKIVYHYSLDNQDKKVIKTYSVGTKPEVLSAKELGFTSDDNIFLGWNGYRERENEWILFNKDASIVNFGAYQSQLYLLLSGKEIVFAPKAGDAVHLFGSWMNANKIDVSHYYFSGNYNGESQDYSQIQNALNIAKTTDRQITVYVPKKTYTITNSLRIFSDTNLVLEDGAVIVRDPSMSKGEVSGSDKGAPMLISSRKDGSITQGGYNQGQNISVQGGIWKGNATSSARSEGNIMRFNHGNNLTVKNCTLTDFNSKHAIVFAGCKNIVVSGVTIQNYQNISGSYLNINDDVVRSHAEALHTDACCDEGEPGVSPIDGTICENVTIENCKFINVLSAVGNHVLSKTRSKNYVVKNCTFQNIRYYCLNLYSRQNVMLSNNTVIGCENCYAYIYNNDSTVQNDQPNMPIAGTTYDTYDTYTSYGTN